MSVSVTDDLARQWARALEEREAERLGISRSAARIKVAHSVGATTGTMENLIRGRMKGVREWLFSNLLSAVTAMTEREIAALTHEHQKLIALGRGRDDGAVQEVAAGLEKLRELMNVGARQ